MKRLITAAALFVLSIPLYAQQLDNGTLMYCVERAKTARDIAQSLAEGADINKLNLAFFHSPRDEADNRYREGWAQALKDEVAKTFAALPPSPERADRTAQKIVEACAYEHGKKRLKKTAIKQVASSEALRKPRREACRAILMDEIYIGQAIAHGKQREEMELRASAQAERLGADRYAKIQELLAEAFATTDQDGNARNAIAEVQAWFDMKLAKCLGREA